MQIYVDNKLAALKKGTSFEYVSENRMFSGSDGYTLTITFPLKDCPQNIAIFGHINRADVIAQRCIFNCEIRDKNFYKFGCITVTEINESEVKTQFLDGRSEQNFDKTFDKIYINELDLGTPPTTSKSAIAPERAWSPIYNPNCVALPWVNDYSGNIQNLVDYHPEVRNNGVLVSNAYYSWSNDITGLSWQPFLLYITKKICESIEYAADFSEWEENEEYKYLLICNTLPHAWYLINFARALPHWTVEEYFEKLELFLQGEFTIDHRAKRVTFHFTENVLRSTAPVELQNVVEDHSTEVKVEEEQCEYSVMKNLVYKECDHDTWKYYSCDWFIKGNKWRIVSFRSLSELMASLKSFRTWDGRRGRDSNIDKIFYAEDCDCHFIIETVSRYVSSIKFGRVNFTYRCILRPINLFGGRIVNDDEDADQDEIEFVPVRIDSTEDKYGRCMFLNFSGYDEDTGIEGEDESKYPFLKTRTSESLAAGEQEKKAEYYDRIYIGFWDGAQNTMGKLPYPWTEDVIIADDWSGFNYAHFNLRINNRFVNKTIAPKIEPKQKTTFKFLSDTIPDVRAIFYIKGKRYICEKLTSTFTENGKSDLVKGVFYPVKD
ncbi:MAG: hypothetical protein NC339_03155 [Muribaculaceae bacterium]|nr:hypothetical protein [Muribaculaceae bacterium]